MKNVSEYIVANNLGLVHTRYGLLMNKPEVIKRCFRGTNDALMKCIDAMCGVTIDINNMRVLHICTVHNLLKAFFESLSDTGFDLLDMLDEYIANVVYKITNDTDDFILSGRVYDIVISDSDDSDDDQTSVHSTKPKPKPRRTIKDMISDDDSSDVEILQPSNSYVAQKNIISDGESDSDYDNE